MAGLNRQERRTLERLGLLTDEGLDQNLREWLEEGEKVARRREVWAVAQRAAMVVQYEMKRNVWWRRWLREIQHFFHRVLPDPLIGETEMRREDSDD